MIAAVISLLVAGMVGSTALYRHTSILTWLSLGGLLFELLWLLLSLLARSVFMTVSDSTVFMVGGGIALVAAIWLGHRRGLHLPFGRANHSLALEGIVIAILAIVLMSGYVVLQANGFQDHEWITHGFYNGDTATFLSLTHRSFGVEGLVQENPFAGNGALEYPTLLHAGVADLFQELGVQPPILYLLPIMTLGMIFFTIPMFFLLWDSMVGRRNALLGAGVILYVLALGWDGYIYPQSHFFLTGLFLLLVFLFHEATKQTTWRLVYEGLGYLTAIVLLLSNAVTGTAALVVAGLYVLFLLLMKIRQESQIVGIAMAAILAWLFISATPGEASIGAIRFPYTAAGELLRYLPAIGVVLVGLFLAEKKFTFIRWAALLVAGLTFVVYFFSARNIVNENASRFLYHAVLIAFPFMVEPIYLIVGWFREAFTRMTHPFFEGRALVLSAMVIVLLVMLPAFSSVASAFDNLTRKDEQIISTPYRSALWWIEDNTSPDAVFLASPKSPFAIPLVTGRSLLRADYWLSPDDVVLANIQDALDGSRASLEQVAELADYVLLSDDNRAAVEPLPADHFEPVYNTKTFVIYRNLTR